jgi:hypothetical protein
MTQLGSEILEFSPDRAVADRRIVGNGLVLWGTVFLGAYVAGLVFMFQVRRGAAAVSGTANAADVDACGRVAEPRTFIPVHGAGLGDAVEDVRTTAFLVA